MKIYKSLSERNNVECVYTMPDLYCNWSIMYLVYNVPGIQCILYTIPNLHCTRYSVLSKHYRRFLSNIEYDEIPSSEQHRLIGKPVCAH